MIADEAACNSRLLVSNGVIPVLHRDLLLIEIGEIFERLDDQLPDQVLQQ
jgi:hypothetical protein